MTVLETLLATTLLAAVPLMLAATGEAIGQRSGLLNLGVEGVMLIGGFVAFVVVEAGGGVSLGLVAGLGGGALIGCGFGVAATRFGAGQIVLGLGIVLLGQGLTDYLFRERFGTSQPLPGVGMARPFRDLVDVPVIGPALFGQRWFVYVAFGVVLLVAIVLRLPRVGLPLRAVGEAPFAADAAGVNVGRVRVLAALLGQALVGLGGASLAVVEVGFFSPGMTVGIGFIAIAIAMVARQRPLIIVALALGFGLLRGVGPALQLADVPVSTEVLHMLPYLGVLALVVLIGRSARLPRALGVAYHRTVRNG